MGAQIDVANERSAGGEPLADLRVRGADLHGIDIPPALVPLAIDEFPALLVAAACARGETLLSGARELRVKESDRIAAMAAGLSVLGVDAEVRDDGMVIRGGVVGGGRVESLGDHRIAMAFSMAGLRATEPVVVTDCANVATSFPGFVSLARDAGLSIVGADSR
jgi:3-phosphoshikimate 1-carboxyvinyltransferase